MVAMTALVTMAALAGAGRAQAAPDRGRPGAARSVTPAAAGVISTVAGGVGGPGRATTVALPAADLGGACGVSFHGGSLYVADFTTVRQVSARTDRLTTPAGTGALSPMGNGGPAAKAAVRTCDMTVDGHGNLVLADERGLVKVVAASTGTFYGVPMTAGNIYVVAGSGSSCCFNNGGLATDSGISPNGVAVDAAGNLVITDGFNGSLVAVLAASTGTFYGQAMTAGHIYDVAGTGTEGFAGDGGPALSAEFDQPNRVAVDAAGNLVISDTSFDINGNQRIRVVAERTGTFYGVPMTAGDIYTVAGTGTAGFNGDGGKATSAELFTPQGVAIDGAGNLLVGDYGNNRVRVVAGHSGTFYGQAMAAGHIYTVAGDGTGGFTGDGGPATSAELSAPAAVTVDTAGNLVIADSGNARVRVVAARTGTFYAMAMKAGHIYTVAGNGHFGFSGDGGPATAAELGFPARIRVDSAGNQIITDSAPTAQSNFGGNNRIRVAAARTGTFYATAMTAGDMYTVAGDGTAGFSGDGGLATRAELNVPHGATADRAGNLVIADTGNNRVRAVAAVTGTFYGRAMLAGHIYTVAGYGTAGFSGDGGPATAAELNQPGDVAVDAAGNLVIADTTNLRVRVVAASTGTFYGRAMLAGHIYTVAGDGTAGASGDGGPATSAQLEAPPDVALDPAGNLLICDGFDRIRMVAEHSGTFFGQAMTARDIYTVAGGQLGFTGIGGPATSAGLTFPLGVAADGAGNLLIADTSNNTILVVAAGTGTFYGQAMTVGNIYAVAGHGGGPGFAGDGRPATSLGVEMNLPEGVAVDASGHLLIADTRNNRIRAVTG